jgi:hypothetical protein
MGQISNTNGGSSSSQRATNLGSTSTGSFGGGTEPSKVVSDVKDAATEAASKAKTLVAERVAETTERSAGDLGDVARALHETSKQLEGNVASPYIDKAAGELERLSGYLRRASVPEIARNVESFARREPALFLGGAFVLGIAAARFLKSSAREGQGESGGDYLGRLDLHDESDDTGEGDR